MAAIDIEMMEELAGGFSTIVNFPEYLSGAGESYFVQALKTWRADTERNLQYKLAGLSQEEIEFKTREEELDYFSKGIHHDLVTGPISILRANADIKFIDLTLEYISEQDEISDVGLYNHLNRYRMSSDGSVGYAFIAVDCGSGGDASYDDDNSDEDDDEDDLDPDDPEEDYVDETPEYREYELSCFSIRDIFEMFRWSQTDMLSKFEVDLMHQDYRASIVMDYTEPGKLGTAVENNKALELGRSELPHIEMEKMISDQAKSLVRIINDTRKHSEDHIFSGEANAYTFTAAQMMLYSWEMTQAFLYENTMHSRETLLSFNQEADVYKMGFPLEEYRDYYERNRDISRIPLDSPEEYMGKVEELSEYVSFTERFYETFSEEGKQQFDSFLQRTLDKVSEEIGEDRVLVMDVRQHEIAFRRPMVT